ncbi:hypothetical protein BDP27DRAFT_1416440 [Rhodocollybia butyracea]|uniref:Uncharacterized protein n=1 Tax=Rhodocollybia butyracea TaxID=206335 RepID=A0A9P5UDD5_9AGAR|nr:hypothetical protein BDP27DRAFT_1416440 [Rhodocollybia butyracea]
MTATVMIWDIVLHIADDVELLSLPGRFQSPTVVHFLSRFLSLVFSCVIFADNAQTCAPTLTVVAIGINFVALAFTLFQFFIRVRVIYCEDSWFKTGFFATLWVLASGGASLNFDFNVATPLAGCTKHPSTSVLIRLGLPILAILVYDSCVFLAISFQIYKLSSLFVGAKPQCNQKEYGTRDGPTPQFIQSFKARALTLVGRELPSLTRAILQDGQLYYLMSLGVSAITLVLLLHPSIYSGYRPLLVPMHTVLLNIMAGYVFREVRLGRMRERELSTLAITLHQQHQAEETLSLHSIRHDEEAEEDSS